ncbi:hypothetical protein F4810DRAFT_648198 [Camillea tinctor]|nr:hypothetical protein F4810DRAFT_648198 [Camillea tinctor]
MGASSVLLGLLPVVLSQLGPTTAEQGLLALRRPFLALLVAAASPAVNPLRNTEYDNTLHSDLPRALPPPRFSSRRGRRPSTLAVALVALAQYTVGFTAVANTVILAYQLSIWSVTSFAVRFPGLPAIWIFLALPIHLGSHLAMRLRVRYERLHDDDRGCRGGVGYLGMLAREELAPCRFQEGVRLTWLPRRKVVGALTWFVYTGVVIYILVGTLTLSGLLFISAADTVDIAARFVGGAIVCKWIFTFELDGIQDTTMFVVEEEDGDDGAPLDELEPSPLMVVAEEGNSAVMMKHADA